MQKTSMNLSSAQLDRRQMSALTQLHGRPRSSRRLFSDAGDDAPEQSKAQDIIDFAQEDARSESPDHGYVSVYSYDELLEAFPFT